MLQDIYLQYSDEVFDYLLAGIRCDMDGAQLIETLIRRYYSYMKDHPEAFCFVEQFANCPSMQLLTGHAVDLSVDRAKEQSSDSSPIQRQERQCHLVLSGEGTGC